MARLYLGIGASWWVTFVDRGAPDCTCIGGAEPCSAALPPEITIVGHGAQALARIRITTVGHGARVLARIGITTVGHGARALAHIGITPVGRVARALARTGITTVGHGARAFTRTGIAPVATTRGRWHASGSRALIATRRHWRAPGLRPLAMARGRWQTSRLRPLVVSRGIGAHRDYPVGHDAQAFAHIGTTTVDRNAPAMPRIGRAEPCSAALPPHPLNRNPTPGSVNRYRESSAESPSLCRNFPTRMRR